MSSSDRRVSAPLAASPWSIAARLALWYTASAFVVVAVATGLLYWVLVTNVSREDDQFLVDTVQIMRAVLRERPNDIAALRQEVDWEGAARRYARTRKGFSPRSSSRSAVWSNMAAISAFWIGMAASSAGPGQPALMCITDDPRA